MKAAPRVLRAYCCCAGAGSQRVAASFNIEDQPAWLKSVILGFAIGVAGELDGAGSTGKEGELKASSKADSGADSNRQCKENMCSTSGQQEGSMSQQQPAKGLSTESWLPQSHALLQQKANQKRHVKRGKAGVESKAQVAARRNGFGNTGSLEAEEVVSGPSAAADAGTRQDTYQASSSVPATYITPRTGLNGARLLRCLPGSTLSSPALQL